MKRKYRITTRRSLRYYAFLFMMFGLFLTLLEIRSGWIGRQPWDEAIWRAAFSFVGIGGLGAILWLSPQLSRKGNSRSLSKIAEANRRPRRSFAEMIGANTDASETGEEPVAPAVDSQDERADSSS
ncbi:MAG: hypothetical protein MK108_01425 [Mariniblastus sp.]|nr:hypothetical protein [Mariniblastus sp.]